MELIKKASKVVGGQAALAFLLGISPSAVNQWAKGTRPVPVDKCTAIERATKGEVTRKELRPDDWIEIWPELATPDDLQQKLFNEASIG